jgi:AraC-like DNA-binding protein
MDKIDQPEVAHLLSKQVTRARYFFQNLLPSKSAQFVLVMGGWEQCSPEYVISRRQFPFYAIEFVKAGHGSVKLDGRRHALRPGSIFTYAPSTHCEIHNEAGDPMVKYFLNFSGRSVPQWLRACKLPPGQARVVSSHANLAGIFDEIIHEGQHASTQAVRICQTLFSLLLLKVEGDAAVAGRTREPAREAFLRCKGLIDARARELGTLEDIAQAAGVEPASVCRWFRRYHGASPYQYLLRRKINLAAEYLLEHGGLVKEAASSVGFSDPFHFSRRFKAVHGVAPSALLHYKQIPRRRRRLHKRPGAAERAEAPTAVV